MNAIHTLSEIGQQSMNNVYNNNYNKLNATANDHMLTQCDKRGENTEGKGKSNEVLRTPTKFVPITCFCKQQNNRGTENNNDNANNNRHNFLMNDVETELEIEVDTSQITIK